VVCVRRARRACPGHFTCTDFAIGAPDRPLSCFAERHHSTRMQAKFACIPCGPACPKHMRVFLPALASRVGLVRASRVARAARQLPAILARAQARRRRPPVAVRGSRDGGKQSRLLPEAAASLSALFADAPRATSSCRRLILRKAIFTNRRYSIMMQFFTLLTSLRIRPN
jgi:hypothetical protein